MWRASTKGIHLLAIFFPFILFAGSKVDFFINTGLYCGNQRAMRTDEVCGRPLDSFARRQLPTKFLPKVF
jgi:hypothetical protein